MYNAYIEYSLSSIVPWPINLEHIGSDEIGETISGRKVLFFKKKNIYNIGKTSLCSATHSVYCLRFVPLLIVTFRYFSKLLNARHRVEANAIKFMEEVHEKEFLR